MAKSGFWLRGAKGKLAGSTIYKGKQGTMMREIVTPTNPKSRKQMLHRSMFLDAVKFFHTAEKNLFRFAFENKKDGWSDFNAFMNANSKAGVNITKAMNECTSYPALGSWITSRGSLPSLNLAFASDAYAIAFATAASAAPTTVGDLSKMIEADYLGAQDGDYLTLTAIVVNEDYDYPDLDPVSGSAITWKIVQIKLDSTDTTTLASVLGSFPFAMTAATNKISFACANTTPCGMIAMLSRYDSTGTTVNDSELVNNTAAETAIAAHQTEAYINQCLSSWGAKDDAILQGSLVQ